jgi:hypothetical protein
LLEVHLHSVFNIFIIKLFVPFIFPIYKIFKPLITFLILFVLGARLL